MERLRLNGMPAFAAALMVLGVAACATHRADTAGLYDEPPQRLWSPPLAYPDSLMLAQVEGTVVLLARVDTNGRVDRASITVLSSTDPGFEAPAIEMLYGTRFRPAYLQDSPTAAVIEVPVKFELGNEVQVEDSMAAAEAVAEGERLAREGAIEAAIVMFTEARRLDTRIASSPTIWWTMCWYGSIWDQAEDVLGACDRLLTLLPHSVSARDARGIARALTGDFRGAIADFEMVIAMSTILTLRAERDEWILALEDGRNPVTPEVLERLRSREP